MPNDDLHFSRSGTSHFGKLTTEVKTRLSEDEKADLMRASHIVGMSESEFVREIVVIEGQAEVGEARRSASPRM